jgi:hypothetical protein
MMEEALMTRLEVLKKGKAIPVRGCGGLQGCEMLRITPFLNNQLTAGSVVFILMHQQHFPPPPPILFAICTSTFSKLYKRHIQWHVKECSVAFPCN